MDIINFNNTLTNDDFVNGDFAIAVTQGQKFVTTLQKTLKNLINITPIPIGTLIKLNEIINRAITVLENVKTAYIYGNYNAEKSFLEQIKILIKSIVRQKIGLAHLHKSTPKTTNNICKIKDICKLEAEFKLLIKLSTSIFDNMHNSEQEAKNATLLVGTLRNPHQLTVALNKRFYHIPKFLVEHPENIKCIAIYQSKNLFGNNSGIKYYGKVLGYTILPRRDIKQIPSSSGVPYVIFELAKWKVLKTPIKADYIGNSCIFSNLYRLMHCEKASELTLNAYEYKLLLFMNKLAYTNNIGCMTYKSGSAEYNGKYFEIKKDGKTIYKITNKDFFEKEAYVIKAITAMLD